MEWRNTQNENHIDWNEETQNWKKITKYIDTNTNLLSLNDLNQIKETLKTEIIDNN